MRTAAAGNMSYLLTAALALVPLAAARAQQPPPATLHVSGAARITAKPDRVQIDVGVLTHAAQSEEAAAQNARQADAVLAAVRKAAPAAELKTISYALNPNYQYHPNGGAPTIDGYNATNLVRVTLDDLGRIGAVIDSATQAGANRVQSIQFTLRDQDSVRFAALREAATRARAEADVLAAALGLRIVRVLSVEENSPRLMPVPMMGAMTARAAGAAAPTPVEGGTLDLTAEVTLSVEVSPAAR